MYKQVMIYWGDSDVVKLYILSCEYGHGNIIIQ